MRYAPSLLEKLTNSSYLERPGQILSGLPLDELIQSVAKDLEALLNTRCALRGEDLERFPLSKESVYNFGIPDFSSMSLASSVDRSRICAAIKETIENQDRRLSNVQVAIQGDTSNARHLIFTIQAVLRVSQSDQLVNFDAHFEPAAQRYSVVCESS
jgi:type VI secretion system protein ImpF